MDETDMQLLSAVQDGFPITPRPFCDLGRALGLPEAEVIERLAGLQKEGLVRRIGPILDLRKLGRSGILAAMKVPREEADGAAKVMHLAVELARLGYDACRKSGAAAVRVVNASVGDENTALRRASPPNFR